MEVDAVEIRVLGCLIEKQRTTPDQYPLSLNALRLACNQTTNRDPVVEYDERMIKAALDRMSHRGWTRFASGASSRALKYRHIPTVMVRFPRENQELSRSGEPKHRVERLQHIVGWMDQWLQGKKNAAYTTP